MEAAWRIVPASSHGVGAMAIANGREIKKQFKSLSLGGSPPSATLKARQLLNHVDRSDPRHERLHGQNSESALASFFPPLLCCFFWCAALYHFFSRHHLDNVSPLVRVSCASHLRLSRRGKGKIQHILSRVLLGGGWRDPRLTDPHWQG